MKITHQTQPTPYACVHTCLAMLTDRPAQSLLDQFPSYGMDLRETFVALEALGLQWNQFVFGRLLFPALYLVSAPSLNIEGGSHAVLLDTRSGLTVVYDPNEGRPGKKFYVGEDRAPEGLAVRITNWTETIAIATS